MEDAMIVNKSSVERGMAAGCILKSDFIELPTVSDYKSLFFLDIRFIEIIISGSNVIHFRSLLLLCYVRKY